MDFFRPRAIPALIALGFAPLAAADCAPLDGTYQYRSEKSGNDTDTFGRLVLLPQGEAKKLYKSESPQPQGFASNEPRQRQKVTHYAQRVRVEAGQVLFLDAAGATLAKGGLDSMGKWSCAEGRLARSSERMTGVGDNIRTERVDETLQREGDVLVHTETTTTIDPPGGKPRRMQLRFKAAP